MPRNAPDQLTNKTEKIMSDTKKKKAARYLIENKIGTMYGTQVYIGENLERKLKTILLYNGYNSVPSHIWDEVQKNPVVKAYVDTQKISITKKDLPDLTAEEAKSVVNGITDLRYLNIIEAREERASVISAVNKRIAFVKNGGIKG